MFGTHEEQREADDDEDQQDDHQRPEKQEQKKDGKTQRMGSDDRSMDGRWRLQKELQTQRRMKLTHRRSV